ncbi:hypothetical protein BTVI_86536 [Pitangus sulphuratus]|nr:hypothetical protein BTVI_86536 [Pitangus sulphuratus]
MKEPTDIVLGNHRQSQHIPRIGCVTGPSVAGGASSVRVMWTHCPTSEFNQLFPEVKSKGPGVGRDDPCGLYGVYVSRFWKQGGPTGVAYHGEAAVPLQPMEGSGSAEIHLQPVEETPTGAGGCLKEAVTPWEAHAGAGPGRDLQICGEKSPHWSRFLGRICDPVEDPHWSSLFLKCLSAQAEKMMDLHPVTLSWCPAEVLSCLIRSQASS